MKTTKILFSILFIFSSMSIHAQLQVTSSGRVDCNNQVAIFSKPNNNVDGMDVVYSNPSIPNYVDLIWGKFTTSQPNNPGLLRLESMDGAYFTVRANGRVGIFNDNPSCALEVGTSGTSHAIKINGSLVLTSDERVKKNIKNIGNSLDKLKKINGISYNFKGISETEAKTENSSLSNQGFEGKSPYKPKDNKNNIGRIYYGFSAQEIQKSFPNLVYKDSAGMLGLDYIGMIPLLVNALNEQQATIDAQNDIISNLESRLSKLENNSAKMNANTSKSTEETDMLSYPVLEQNAPNPFNTSTTIAFYLPTSIAEASIYIYDMNGGQIKSYPITSRANGNIIIQGSEFGAGMYLYALVADGKVIDTKRMILTK